MEIFNNYYAQIDSALLRDYLIFLVSLLSIIIGMALYIGIKNYAVSNRIEKRMVELQETKDQNLIEKEFIQNELVRKSAHLKDAENLLERTNRMATLGTLVAGIAHDINNPLGYVSSNIFSLSSYLKDSSQIIESISTSNGDEVASALLLQDIKTKIKKEKLDITAKDTDDIVNDIRTGMRQIRDIVHDLQVYSRSEQDNFAYADINECVRRIANIIKPEIKHKIVMALNLGSVPPFYCIESKLQQVILNLLINAAQAMKGTEGKITVSTSTNKDGGICIAIADTGCGISAENMEKMYQAFFTTKPPGEGTGLGLAISDTIIKKHGGSLTCTSKMGEGSEFTILLPGSQVINEPATYQSVISTL